MNCDHPHVLSNGIDVILFVKRMCEKKKLNIYKLVLLTQDHRMTFWIFSVEPWLAFTA